MNKKGFTLIELLIVIAIIGILAGLVLSAVSVSRNKAHDTAIQNDIRQLRIVAEKIFSTQSGSYMDWASHTEVVGEVAIIVADIDKHAAGTNNAVILESRDASFCVSSPLRSNANYYCVDDTGIFTETSGPCTEPADPNASLRCTP